MQRRVAQFVGAVSAVLLLLRGRGTFWQALASAFAFLLAPWSGVLTSILGLGLAASLQQTVCLQCHLICRQVVGHTFGLPCTL